MIIERTKVIIQNGIYSVNLLEPNYLLSPQPYFNKLTIEEYWKKLIGIEGRK